MDDFLLNDILENIKDNVNFSQIIATPYYKSCFFELTLWLYVALSIDLRILHIPTGEKWPTFGMKL